MIENTATEATNERMPDLEKREVVNDFLMRVTLSRTREEDK